MKPIDFIVIGVIALFLIIAIISIIVDKKKGKTTCGCDCASCQGCSSKSACCNQSAKKNK